MARSIGAFTKKRRGRPITTGKGTLIGVRLQPSHLIALDAWIARQSQTVTRPEAIRAMMETILHILSKDTAEKLPQKAKKTEKAKGRRAVLDPRD
jgi:hypothetical protein